MIDNHKKILLTIKRIRESDPLMVSIYTKGSCFNFYTILKSIYPEAVPYYNSDHIITKINEKFYDINGEVFNSKNYLNFYHFFSKKTMSKVFKQMYYGNHK